MSKRELKALPFERREFLSERRLRSGAIMSSETELEELRQQLERTQAQLDRTKVELTSKEKELEGARESMKRLKAELRTASMEAELDKLRTIEALRKILTWRGNSCPHWGSSAERSSTQKRAVLIAGSRVLKKELK